MFLWNVGLYPPCEEFHEELHVLARLPNAFSLLDEVVDAHLAIGVDRPLIRRRVDHSELAALRPQDLALGMPHHANLRVSGSQVVSELRASKLDAHVVLEEVHHSEKLRVASTLCLFMVGALCGGEKLDGDVLLSVLDERDAE